MALEVDAAFHDSFVLLGEAMAQAGLEDSSGLRRALWSSCVNLDVPRMQRLLGIEEQDARWLIIDAIQAAPRRRA